MQQGQATQIVRGLLDSRVFDVFRALRNGLGVEPRLLRFPRELQVIVNDQRTLKVKFAGGQTVMSDGNFNFTQSSNEAACYVPTQVAISISGETVEEVAQAIGIGEPALLEILCLHEFVHLAMMGGFADSPDAIAWLTGPSYRYIHEATALKAVEFGFGEFWRAATAQDVKAYLDHVDEESRTRASGLSYRRYFDEYRVTPIEDFWAAICAEEGIGDFVERIAAIRPD